MNKIIQNDLTAEIVKTNNPRIGVIALSTDFTIEQDYRNICHSVPVDIFVNRIPFENPLNHENYLKMADYISDVSSQILPSEEIDIIAYGCTSGTIAIGSDRIKEEVNKTKPKAFGLVLLTSSFILSDPIAIVPEVHPYAIMSISSDGKICDETSLI